MAEAEQAAEAEQPAETETPAEAPSATGTYWLRVWGYPTSVGEELISFPDFYDPLVGPLRGDPREHLRAGDIVVYYADGPSCVFAVAEVSELSQVPHANGQGGPQWKLVVRPRAVIPEMNKAPHAGWLEPPSGWHFLRAAPNYTFIRLPDGDGPYLVEQVRARASTKGE